MLSEEKICTEQMNQEVQATKENERSQKVNFNSFRSPLYVLRYPGPSYVSSLISARFSHYVLIDPNNLDSLRSFPFPNICIPLTTTLSNVSLGFL